MKPEQIQTMPKCCSHCTFLLKQVQEMILTTVQASDKYMLGQICLATSLLEQAGKAVIATDLAGKIIYWNAIAQTLYQWESKEVLGKSILEVVFCDPEFHIVETIVKDLYESGIWQGDLIVQRQDATSFTAKVACTAIKDAEAKITGFLTISENISQPYRTQQSETNISQTCQNSLQSILIIDYNSKVKFFNKTASQWIKINYQKDIKIGDAISSFINTTEEIIDFNRHFQLALQGKSSREQKIFKSADNTYQIFELNYTPVIDESGQIQGVCQMSLEIEQKKSVEEIVKSERRFRAIVQNSLDIITILEADSTISYVSPSVEHILGYIPEDLIGKKAFDYLHPEDKHLAEIKLVDIISQTNLISVNDIRLRHANGNWIYVESFANNLLEEPNTKGIVVNCRDITKRKQAEIELHRQREREQLMSEITQKIRQSLNLQDILQTTATQVRQFLQADRVLIYHFPPTWNGVMNAEVESVSPGWSPVMGQPITDICFTQNHLQPYKSGNIHFVEDIYNSGLTQCHIDLLAQFQVRANMIVPILQGENLWGLIMVHQCSNPKQWQSFEIDLVKQISTQVAIAIQQAQLYQQLSSMNADLEKQVRARTVEMEQKVQQLEHLNLLKDDFLSTVSHELRTPLTNMKMAIQMVKLAPNCDRRLRYIQILEAECARETELINDLLDLQRLEAASYPVCLEPISLQTWSINIIEPFYSRAQDRQQTLIINVPNEIPTLFSDSATLERILAELLNNACKYTPASGKIIVQVSYDPNSSPSADSTPLMSFKISNQAEIAATELPRIFEKFYRVPHADRWKQGGTGLGLALVQKFVSQLEGQMEVESNNGWTSFTIKLPVHPSAKLMATGHKLLV